MQKKLLEDFQSLGLNGYEAKVYLALLERKSLAVSEVSKLSQVPRARAYDILDKLVANGFASLKPGKYKKYSAADLNFFQEKLIQQNEERYIEQKNNIEKVTLTIKKQYEPTLKENAFSANPLDYIEIVKDPYQIHYKFMQFAGAAKEEILVFTKAPYSVPREKLTEQTNQETEVLKKKIKVMSIYEIPKEEDEKRWLFNIMDQSVKSGEEAKVIKELPLKLAIFDSRIVLYVLEDPISEQPSVTTQIVEHRALAKTLKITFNTLWKKAEDYHILESSI